MQLSTTASFLLFLLWYCCYALAASKSNKDDLDLSCKDPNGVDVDWFLVYKLPKVKKSTSAWVREGLGFAYLLPGNKDWQFSAENSINSSDNLVAGTLSRLYHNSFHGQQQQQQHGHEGIQDSSNEFAYILYNDQKPDGSVDFNNGHTKGVIMSTKNGGFWLQHSVPHFPDTTLGQFIYPHTGTHYGQIFHCLNLEADQVDNIGNVLEITKPHVFNYSIPKLMSSVLPTLTRIVSSPKFTFEDFTRNNILENKNSANNHLSKHLPGVEHHDSKLKPHAVNINTNNMPPHQSAKHSHENEFEKRNEVMENSKTSNGNPRNGNDSPSQPNEKGESGSFVPEHSFFGENSVGTFMSMDRGVMQESTNINSSSVTSTAPEILIKTPHERRWSKENSRINSNSFMNSRRNGEKVKEEPSTWKEWVGSHMKYLVNERQNVKPFKHVRKSRRGSVSIISSGNMTGRQGSAAWTGIHIDLANGNGTNNKIFKLTTRAGRVIYSFAKGPSFHEEIYSDWIAPKVKSSLKVQSWLNGAHWYPSNCTSHQFPVYNIQDKEVAGTSFSIRGDHSKWALALQHAMVCIGDLNRMEAQKDRGGCVNCFLDKSVWKVFKKSVTSIQPCPMTG